jgi:CubicO group peptidase (beta-lactamase class C family)
MLLATPSRPAASAAPPVLQDPTGAETAQLAGEIEGLLVQAYGGAAPGAGMMVLDGDETVLLAAAGLADLEWQVPATAETSFRVGSLSKPLTAIAILRRVSGGVLDIDRPVGDYLPDLPDALGRPTLAQLLSHTSGLPDHFQLPDAPAIMRNPTTPGAIVERMRDAEPLFPPGERWAYSNFNYVLLGLVLEATDPAGRDYGRIIEEDIFAPLGMTDSHYDRQAAVLPRRARGYDHDGERVLNTVTFDPSHAYAAGALMMSAADMVRLSRALLDGDLLSDAMRARAWRETTGPDGQGYGYGLGFNTGTLMGERVIWHNGSINGFQAAWLMLPERGRAVAVLSNGYYRPNTTAMARRVLALLAGRRLPALEAVPVEDAVLAGLEGRYALDDGRVLQIHVDGGARYNLNGGGWRELDATADGILFRPGSLTHLRPRAGEPGLVLVSGTTLEETPAVPLPGPVEGARSSVAVTPAMARRAAGNWRLASGDIVRVRAGADGTLSLQLPQQPARPLLAESPVRYFTRGVPIELQLHDEAGQATLNLYGNLLPLTRQPDG